MYRGPASPLPSPPGGRAAGGAPLFLLDPQFQTTTLASIRRHLVNACLPSFGSRPLDRRPGLLVSYAVFFYLHNFLFHMVIIYDTFTRY
jgi:hypothetical protein